MQSKTRQPLTDPFELLKQGCERPWEVAVPPFQVAPRTWYVGNGWVGAYLIGTSEGFILIDATMQPQVYLLFESIRMLGFNPADIKLLLLSHGHYDHCGGVRAVVEASGAKLFMSREDAKMMEERPDLVFTEGYPFGEFEIDGFFSDKKPMVLGDMEVTTVHTPGHTPGTTSFFFSVTDEAGNRYRCGLHGGVGVNTLSDDYFTTCKVPVSLRRDYLNSMLKVRDFEVDITLGSHPGQIGMLEKVADITPSHNPFLDRTVWPDLIDSRMAMAKELMGESAAAG